MKLYAFHLHFALLLALTFGGRALAVDPTNFAAPVTARDFYNAGAELLAAKKFAVAQQMFESALAAQDERVQPPALYNLGHARFDDGVERLKEGPDAERTGAQGDAALVGDANAIHSMEAALADTNLDRMVAAYLEGRGARHRVRDAQKAVQAAVTDFGYTLGQWQGAVDDFKSASELNPSDTNAVWNAQLVEGAIARLVDSVRRMQQMAGLLGDQGQQLGQLMGKLKGRIPAPNAPPGGWGDQDEEGRQPESLAGQREGASRDGSQEQIQISPEVAQQVLDSLLLDSARRLPMSQQPSGPPGERPRRNW
ncbi:MAG: hypothetical protein ABSE16_10500 [Verrucomicrobiota bacterium]|jgi:tetratricopeptide (TPR) repeat protein